MDNSIKELGKIRDSIISGKITESRLREMINTLKSEFGDDVFKTFDLNSVRQYVYTKPYYERLVQLARNGACSQEFFIHLIHVRDAIKKQQMKHILFIVFCSLLLCSSLFTMGLSLQNNSMLRTLKAENSSVTTNIIEKHEIVEQTSDLVKNEEVDESREAE